MPKVLANVREGILLMGRDLLSEKGYDGFSVRAVAGRCGIGVGTLYNYFQSKQQLVSAILSAEWENHLRRMTLHSKTGDDLIGRLVSIYHELWQFLQGLHSVWADGGGGKSVDPVEFKGIQNQRNLVRQQLEQMIASTLERSSPGHRWLADCIARVFLAYAVEPDQDDNQIVRILGKLLS